MCSVPVRAGAQSVLRFPAAARLCKSRSVYAAPAPHPPTHYHASTYHPARMNMQPNIDPSMSHMCPIDVPPTHASGGAGHFDEQASPARHLRTRNA